MPRPQPRIRLNPDVSAPSSKSFKRRGILARRDASRRRAFFVQDVENLETRVTPASRFWTGAVNNLWSEAGNWDVLPVNGDSLFFPDTGANRDTVNDYAALTNVLSISIGDSGYSFDKTAVNTFTIDDGGGLVAFYTNAGTSTYNIATTFVTSGQAVLSSVTTGTVLDISSVITLSGTGIFAKYGDSTVRLSGTGSNVTGGTFFVIEGKLELNKSNGADAISSNLAIQGGTANLLRSQQINDAGIVNTTLSGASFDLNGFNESIAALNMSGGTSVATGAGTLTIGGSLTYQGGSTTATISGNLDLGGAVRDFDVFDSTAAVDLDISAVISNGGVAKFGNGLLRYSGSSSNTYTGDTTITGGTLSAARTAGTTSIAGSLVLGVGSYTQANANQIADTSSVTLASPSSIFSLGAISETIGAFVLEDALVTLGGGDLTVSSLSMTGASIDTGAGALVLAGNVGINASSSISAIVGNLNLGGSARNINVPDGPASSDLFISAVISNGGVNKSGAGVLEYAGSGANTYSGATTIVGGTLNLNKNAGVNALASTTVQVDNTGLLSLAAANQIPNTTTVSVFQGGTFNFGARTDQIGDLTVTGGSVVGDSGGALSINALSMTGGSINTGAGALTLGGSATTLAATSSATILGNLDLGGASRTFDVADGLAAIDLSIGAIVSNGGLNKSSAGLLELTGTSANTYAGATTVNGGTLNLNKSASVNAIAGPAGVTVSSGTLNIAASEQLPDDLPVTVNAAGSLTVGVNTENLGVLSLAGAASSTDGFLSVAALNATGGSVSTGTGKFVLRGDVTANASANSLTISGNLDLGGALRTFDVADGAALDEVDVSAAISNGGVVKSGAGRLVYSGSSPNTYDMGTTVSAGTFIMNKTAGTDAIASSLTVNGSGAAFLFSSDQINDSVVVTVVGAGFDLGTKSDTISALSIVGGQVNSSGGDLTTSSVLMNGGTIDTTSGRLILLGDLTTVPTDSTAIIRGNLDLGGATRNVNVPDDAPNTELDISAVISNGGVNKQGTGLLRYSGTSSNTYTGITQVGAGNFALEKVGAVAIAGDVNVVGGVLFAEESEQIHDSSDVTVGDAGVYNFGSGMETINALVVSGLVETFGGILTVSSLSMTDGDIRTNAGILNLAGDVTVNASASTSQILGNLHLGAAVRSFTVAEGAASTDLRIGAAIGNGGLTKLGDGFMELDGSNTYDGVTTILGGTVEIEDEDSLGSAVGGTIVASGATLILDDDDFTIAEPLDLAGLGYQGMGALNDGDEEDVEFTGPITLSEDARIHVTEGLELSGIISGPGGIEKTGNDDLVLSGANTYLGATVILDGEITARNGQALGSTSSGTTIAIGAELDLAGPAFTMAEPITFAAGTEGLAELEGSNSSTLTGPITLAGNARISAEPGVTLTVAGIVSGDGGIQKVGNGDLALSGENSYAGITATLAGRIRVQGTNALGLTSNGTTVAMGAGLSVEGTVAVGAEPLFIEGTGTAGEGAMSSPSGVNTWNGPIILVGAASIGVHTGQLTLLGAISGTNPLDKVNSGTLVLGGTNTYDGQTTVNAGVLRVTNQAALGSASSPTSVLFGAAVEVAGNITISGEPLSLTGSGVSSSGALKNVSGTNAWNGPISMTGNSTFGSDSGSLRLGGILGGGFQVQKVGLGAIELSGANTYTGATVVNQGSLIVSHANGLGAASGGVTVVGGADLVVNNVSIPAELLTLNGSGVSGLGALRGMGIGAYLGDVTLGSDSAIGSDSGADLSLPGALNGPFGLTKVGSGRVFLGGPNGFTGAAVVGAGTLAAGSDFALGTTDAGTTVATGASLELLGNVMISEPLTINGDGVGSLGAVRSSSGMNALTGLVSLGSNVTLDVAEDALTIQQGIGGSFGLTKIGSGDLILAGANTFTGGTTTRGGEIVLTGSLNLDAMTTVEPGAVLSGTGTVGDVTVMAGGTVSPGLSPGILNSGDITFASGSTYFVELNGTIAGTDHDQLNVTGSVVLGGATLSASVGYTPARGDALIIINNDGAEPISGSFAGLPEGGYVSFGAGQQFRLTYIGGDGNDVALIAVSDTATTVVTSFNPAIVGESITFTATVTTPGFTPDGTVRFLIDNVEIGTAALTGGEASVSTSIPTAGLSQVTVEFLGGDLDGPSSSAPLSQNVLAADTFSTVLSSSNPSVFGQSVTLTATVDVFSPGSGSPTGLVEFFDGATSLGTATLVSGAATITLSSLSRSSHPITAVYAGDGNYGSSTSSVFSQFVNQANTSAVVSAAAGPFVFGQSVTISATISATAPGSGLPTGLVEFFDGSTSLGSATLDGSGVAAISTTSLSIGTHSISTVYQGDLNFLPSTSASIDRDVTAASTSTVLGTSANPSSFGQATTFTATVSAIAPAVGVPTGSVEFLDGSTSLGIVTLDASGVASLTTSALVTRTHLIRANYLGSAGFSTSTTSNDLVQVVNKAGSTSSVTSSASRVEFGGSVTFTATVTAGATGLVSFIDDGVVLGTVAIVAGSASLGVTDIEVGTHSIVAQYLGDDNFQGSTSPSIAQTIDKASVTVELGSNLAASAFGQSVTFTAIVRVGGSILENPSGTVTFRDGSTVLGSAPLNAGSAVLSIANLSVGGHSITATYDGDAIFATGASSAAARSVSKAETSTLLASVADPATFPQSPTQTGNPAVFGQTITYVAIVSPAFPGAASPTGQVLFTRDGAIIGSADLLNGKAMLTVMLTEVGKPSVFSAAFQGDGNYVTSASPKVTQLIEKAQTVTSFVASASRVGGRTLADVAIQVRVANPGSGTPTGVVTLFINNKAIRNVRVVNGVARVRLSPNSISGRTIRVRYSGDGNLVESTSRAVVVSKGFFRGSARPAASLMG